MILNTAYAQVRSLLHHYVMNDLCKNDPPHSNDRAYFPLDKDLRNHIFRAKRALQLSCIDQENVHFLVERWRKTDPASNHLFRPYIHTDDETPKVKKAGQTSESASSSLPEEEKDDCNDKEDSASDNYQQTLLWVHQSDWQKDLLARYGNLMTLMDATYKTTKYELALFFVCVRTNVGYSVVGEFIVQSENTENIREAIEVLKKWNPKWKPKYFMTDYSEAELTAIETTFPATKTYLCDFHREQAWIRWCRDHKHGLTQAESEELLDLLRACTWAPPGDEPDPTYNYKDAVSRLKSSSVWANHSSVEQWLSSTWLSIPEVHDFYFMLYLLTMT